MKFGRFLLGVGIAAVVYKMIENLSLVTTISSTELRIVPNELSDESEQESERDILEVMDAMPPEKVNVALARLANGKFDDNQNILSPRQKKILSLIQDLGQVDTTVLNTKIRGVTVRTLRRDLNLLEQKGLIRKVGNTKGSYYEKS